MNKDLIAVFEYLEREKGISRDVVINAIEESLSAAARKSIKGASNITVTINPKTGKIDVYCEKEIVDEVEVEAQEISLADAQVIDPDCQLGQFIDVEATPKDFGRIAAQKARQVITQKLRYAERDVIYEEYRHRINDLISGTVKKFIHGANIIVDLGKVNAIMPMRHYPKIEKYRIGEKVFALLYEVKETEAGGAEVILSRSVPEFVRQLLIQEVPEIADGIVIVDKLVREPGYRTKLTVRSTDSRVDPVGACVGMRGNRVKNIVRELHNEKIDIIPYAKDPVELLQNALDPIQIKKISVNEEDKIIYIVVDDDDFAAVIGKKGMNARLNGKLIGYGLEAQRMTDFTRVEIIRRAEMSLQRAELAKSDNPDFDKPLEETVKIDNPLILDNLKERFPTLRELLAADQEQFTDIPGIDDILEKIRTSYKTEDTALEEKGD